MKLYAISALAFYLITCFAVVYAVHFVKEIFRAKSYKKFTTAKGKVDIEEINKNVFEKYGYSLIKNDLIPILKKQTIITCDNVFSEWQRNTDEGLTINPPKEIPNPTLFLLNNYTKLSKFYFNQTPKNTKQTLENWNQTYIDDLVKIAKISPFNIPFSYGKEALAVHSALKDFNVEGQNGAVVGSQIPWVEVFLLVNGAQHITTIDYYKLSIKHPKMDFLYAPDVPLQKQRYYNKFDFIVSFSSIERSGLGRYGDPIDPIGDIREMNKIHCLLKPKGLLFLGFPVGVDTIVFNAHRVYGRIRLAMMFEGFKLLKTYWLQNTVTVEHLHKMLNYETRDNQLLFVLEKN